MTFDLALAAAVLSADRKVPAGRLEKTVLLGELALDGRVRPVRGVLPAVIAAKREGWPAVVVPVDNLAEAVLVDGIEIHGATTLRQIQSWLNGAGDLDQSTPTDPCDTDVGPDLADVVGQPQARFAIEVAAAGAHHLMLTGPPGIGKTMLAQRLPGLLPPLTEEESLEVTAIHSVAGLLTTATPLIRRPPLVAPPHTASVAALIGGGSGMALRGAVSRAHRGVLFLDECAEIGAQSLEALRTPLEEGQVRLARRDGVAVYPARFQLVLAADPCPCAPADPRDCICAGAVKRRYLGKLSGPLLDRVDLRVQMFPGATRRIERRRRGVDPCSARAGGPGARDGGRALAGVRRADQRRNFRPAVAPAIPASPRRDGTAATRVGQRAAEHQGSGPGDEGRVDRLRPRGPRASQRRGRDHRDGISSDGSRTMTGERRAWAYLSRVAEPPCRDLAALAARVGAVEAAARVRRGWCPPSWPVTPRHVAMSTAPLKTSSASIGSAADCSPPTTESGPRWHSPRSTASICAAIPTASRRWRCGRLAVRKRMTWHFAPRQSSEPVRPPRTASTSRPICQRGCATAASRWCPVAHTESTAPRIARRWPRTAARSRC